MKKRLLSMLLAAAMAVSAVPAMALAVTAEDETGTETETPEVVLNYTEIVSDDPKNLLNGVVASTEATVTVFEDATSQLGDYLYVPERISEVSSYLGSIVLPVTIDKEDTVYTLSYTIATKVDGRNYASNLSLRSVLSSGATGTVTNTVYTVDNEGNPVSTQYAVGSAYTVGETPITVAHTFTGVKGANVTLRLRRGPAGGLFHPMVVDNISLTHQETNDAGETVTVTDYSADFTGAASTVETSRGKDTYSDGLVFNYEFTSAFYEGDAIYLDHPDETTTVSLTTGAVDLEAGGYKFSTAIASPNGATGSATVTVNFADGKYATKTVGISGQYTDFDLEFEIIPGLNDITSIVISATTPKTDNGKGSVIKTPSLTHKYDLPTFAEATLGDLVAVESELLTDVAPKFAADATYGGVADANADTGAGYLRVTNRHTKNDNNGAITIINNLDTLIAALNDEAGETDIYVAYDARTPVQSNGDLRMRNRIYTTASQTTLMPTDASLRAEDDGSIISVTFGADWQHYEYKIADAKALVDAEAANGKTVDSISLRAGYKDLKGISYTNTQGNVAAAFTDTVYNHPYDFDNLEVYTYNAEGEKVVLLEKIGFDTPGAEIPAIITGGTPALNIVAPADFNRVSGGDEDTAVTYTVKLDPGIYKFTADVRSGYYGIEANYANNGHNGYVSTTENVVVSVDGVDGVSAVIDSNWTSLNAFEFEVARASTVDITIAAGTPNPIDFKNVSLVRSGDVDAPNATKNVGLGFLADATPDFGEGLAEGFTDASASDSESYLHLEHIGVRFNIKDYITDELLGKVEETVTDENGETTTVVSYTGTEKLYIEFDARISVPFSYTMSRMRARNYADKDSGWNTSNMNFIPETNATDDPDAGSYNCFTLTNEWSHYKLYLNEVSSDSPYRIRPDMSYTHFRDGHSTSGMVFTQPMDIDNFVIYSENGTVMDSLDFDGEDATIGNFAAGTIVDAEDFNRVDGYQENSTVAYTANVEAGTYAFAIDLRNAYYGTATDETTEANYTVTINGEEIFNGAIGTEWTAIKSKSFTADGEVVIVITSDAKTAFDYKNISLDYATYGDADGDGKFGPADITELARAIAGWNGYEIADETILDVNKDTKVNSIDLIILVRHNAGWEGYTLPYNPAN